MPVRFKLPINPRIPRVKELRWTLAVRVKCANGRAEEETREQLGERDTASPSRSRIRGPVLLLRVASVVLDGRLLSTFSS